MQLVQTTAIAPPTPLLAAASAKSENCRRILLAYDYPLVRHAIRSLVECDGYEIAAEASTSADAIRLCRELEPDLMVLDLEMPFVDGLAVVRDILRVSPGIGVVVLTSHSERKRVLDALWAGVRGYILKASEPAHLLRAIQAAVRGDCYYCPEVSGNISDPYPPVAHWEKPLLTDRERQVVKLIAEGNSTKQVAGELGISVKTADSHRTKIMDKLNIHETASLVRFAIRQGLIQP